MKRSGEGGGGAFKRRLVEASAAGGAGGGAPGSQLVTLADGTRLAIACAEERGTRKTMEDETKIIISLRESDARVPPELDACVVAIFDGHGGKATAAFAKHTLGPTIADSILADSEMDYKDSVRVRALLVGVIAKIDQRIPVEIPNCKDGSTAVILFIPLALSPPQAIVATVGDAAGCLCRRGAKGELSADFNKTKAEALTMPAHAIELSVAHKPWALKEKERILAAGGTVEAGRVNGALEVSRSLGDISLKKYGVICRPSFRRAVLDRHRDEFILVGCDGFWSSWSAEDAIRKTAELLGRERKMTLLTARERNEKVSLASVDAKRLCAELVEHVLVEKKCLDNVSLVVLIVLAEDE